MCHIQCLSLCTHTIISASAIADRLGTEFALIHRQRASNESTAHRGVNGAHHGTNGVNGFINSVINGVVDGANGSSHSHVQDGSERMDLLVGDVKDKVG
jgi:phosphoribosylpyrophosphate synthetase